jgi:multidrug efflux pump subunit AcrB
MKAVIILMAVATVFSLVVAFVVFPALEAEVNRTQASAAYQEQQRLMAQAELERARAVTTTAKGEADALRMSINQPIALLAIPMALLALVAVAVLVLTFMRDRQPRRGPQYYEQYQQPRTVNVLVNGRVETLYVPEGASPAMVAHYFLLAAQNRDLVVWTEGTER